MAPLLMIAVLFATTTVAYGGLRWSGIDPQLEVNGHEIAATVFIPTTEACYIDSVIHFRMVLPNGSEWNGEVDESDETYDCDGDGDHTITTYTDVSYADVNRMYVAAKVLADDRFRIKVQVKMDGRTISRCRGYSDRWVKCRGFNVDADDNDDDDDDDDDEKKGKRGHRRGR